MSTDLDHIQKVFDEADCLYTQDEVEGAIRHMAADSLRSWLTKTR